MELRCWAIFSISPARTVFKHSPTYSRSPVKQRSANPAALTCSGRHSSGRIHTTSAGAVQMVHEFSRSRAKLNNSDGQGGDAMHEETSDAVCVDAWLKRVAPNSHSLTADLLLQLFERALGAVWHEAQESLGEVTLTAIATRVLFMSKERFPGLSGISVGGDGISLHELRERTDTLSAHELWGPLRFLLTELLRVLGVLTANVLTPWLQAELSKVALDEPARADADKEPVPVHPMSPEVEEA